MTRTIYKYSFILLFGLLFNSFSLKAQDPAFTQFTSVPLALNPGFTGATPSYRFVSAYKKDQIKIPKAFETNVVSFDYNLYNIKSGIGMQVIMDRSSAIGYTSTTVQSSYAYIIQLRNGWVIRPGIQTGIIFQTRNLSNLRFGDEIINGTPTRENFNSPNRSFFDFSAGTVVHNSKFWFGLALFHLNQPYNDLTAKEFQQDMKITGTGGAKFLLRGFYKEKTYITASYIFEKQGNALRLATNLIYYNKPIILGLALRRESFSVPENSNSSISAGFLSGLRFGDFNFRYNFDLPISGRTEVGGSHEITINFTPIRYRHSNKMIQCPMF